MHQRDPDNDALSAAVAADNRPPRKERAARDDRSDRSDRGPRPGRRGRGDYTPYRIEVGRRNRVEPRQIVGALANEGGLSRDDFGAITIRPDFSIVELPANLDQSVLNRLRDTRIGGRPIKIRRDTGGPSGGARRGRDDRRTDDRRADGRRSTDRRFGERRRTDRDATDRRSAAKRPRKPRHKG